MPLYWHPDGGKLLRRGAALAANSDCCCSPQTCCDCVSDATGVRLTLAGLQSHEQCNHGALYFRKACTHGSMNGSYTLTRSSGTCLPAAFAITGLHVEISRNVTYPPTASGCFGANYCFSIRYVTGISVSILCSGDYITTSLGFTYSTTAPGVCDNSPDMPNYSFPLTPWSDACPTGTLDGTANVTTEFDYCGIAAYTPTASIEFIF